MIPAGNMQHCMDEHEIHISRLQSMNNLFTPRRFSSFQGFQIRSKIKFIPELITKYYCTRNYCFILQYTNNKSIHENIYSQDNQYSNIHSRYQNA